MSHMLMYCPKCGNGLVVRPDGTFYCEAGDMDLAPKVGELLAEAVETQPVQSPPVGAGAPRRFHWYCPRCGRGMVKLSSDNYRLEEQCPQCGFTLVGRMVYYLVERHPHR